MLTRIDRVQITVADRREAVGAWSRLLGGVVVREDTVEPLGAARAVLRLGTSEVELLEPVGIGLTAEHLSRNRGGLFAVGLATPDLERLRGRIDALAIPHWVMGTQLFISSDWLGVPGLRVVISQDAEREPTGLLTHLYEVTHLSHDYRAAATRLAERFDLDATGFVPIRSEEFGYEGTLTLFDRDRLDRIETVTPFDRNKTMGRYFGCRGPRLYMAFAETADTARMRERLLALAPNDWTGPRGVEAPGHLFIHPRALGGVMIGVSRTGHAWAWSGRPDRVPTRVAA